MHSPRAFKNPKRDTELYCLWLLSRSSNICYRKYIQIYKMCFNSMALQCVCVECLLCLVSGHVRAVKSKSTSCHSLIIVSCSFSEAWTILVQQLIFLWFYIYSMSVLSLCLCVVFSLDFMLPIRVQYVACVYVCGFFFHSAKYSWKTTTSSLYLQYVVVQSHLNHCRNEQNSTIEWSQCGGGCWWMSMLTMM